jgi:hypothetical protein
MICKKKLGGISICIFLATLRFPITTLFSNNRIQKQERKENGFILTFGKRWLYMNFTPNASNTSWLRSSKLAEKAITS